MTRDGLTLDNQTTGESINISSREAEQDYSVAEPGGTAEKVLERAGDIRERSKAKRAAMDGANMAAQATGPASRLQFTAEERADPALSKYVHKAEKRADKLDAAELAELNAALTSPQSDFHNIGQIIDYAVHAGGVPS